MGCGVTLRLLLSTSIILLSTNAVEGDRTFAYVADAVGNPLSRPSKVPSKVGSPSYLARPDRYEFYTFDETGELIKRLMTLEEIQEIIASGDGDDGHLLTVAQTDLTKPSPTFNIQPPSNVKVHTIVTNVQNVLKAEMEAQKNNPQRPTIFDTPDVSSSWSMILPAIFGNTGGSITPDSMMSSHIEPETDVISSGMEKESDDHLLPIKEGTQASIDNKNPINETLVTEIDPVTNFDLTANNKNPDFPVGEIKNITSELLNAETKTTKGQPSTTESAIYLTDRSSSIPSTLHTEKLKIEPPTTQRLTTKINTTPSTTTVKFEKITTRNTPTTSKITNKPSVQTTTERIVKPKTTIKSVPSTQAVPKTTTEPTTPVKKIATTIRPATNVFINKNVIKDQLQEKTDLTITKTDRPTTVQYNRIQSTTESEPSSFNIDDIISQIAVDLKDPNSAPVISILSSTTTQSTIGTTKKQVPSTKIPPAATKNTPPTTKSPSTTRIPPSTINNPPPTTRNPPSTTRQPSSTIRNTPSTTKNPPPTIKNTPSTTNNPPSTTRNPPPTTKNTPSTTKYPAVTTNSVSSTKPSSPSVSTKSPSTQTITTKISPTKAPTTTTIKSVTTTKQILDATTKANIQSTTERKPEEKPTFIKLTPILKNKTTVVEPTRNKIKVSENLISIKNVTESALETFDDEYLENTMPTITDSYYEVTKPNFVELSDSITDLISQIVDESRPTMVPLNQVKSTTKRATPTPTTTASTTTPKFETWTVADNVPQQSVKSTIRRTATTSEVRKPTTSNPSSTVSIKVAIDPEEIVPTTYRPITTFINNAEILSKNTTERFKDVSTERYVHKNEDAFEKIENIKPLSSNPPNKVIKRPINKVEASSLKIKEEATTEANVTHDDELMEMLSQVSQIFQISSKVESKSDDSDDTEVSDDDVIPSDKKETSYKKDDGIEQRIQEETIPRIKDIPDIKLSEESSTEITNDTAYMDMIEEDILSDMPDEYVTTQQSDVIVESKEDITEVSITKEEPSTKEDIVSTKPTTDKAEIPSTTKVPEKEPTSPQSSTQASTPKKEKATKKNNLNLSTTTTPMVKNEVKQSNITQTVKVVSTSPVPQTKAADITTAYISSTIGKNDKPTDNWKLVSTVASHSNVESLTSVNIATSTPMKSSTYIKTKLPDKVVDIKVSQPQSSTSTNLNLDVKPKTQGLEKTTSALGEDVLQFSHLCNELAFRYWNSVSSSGVDPKRSLVVSPFAVTSILAMMFLGARGATSGEMNDILKLDDMVTFNPHIVFKNVTESIEVSKKSGVATSAFVRELYSDRAKGRLLSFYKDRVQQFYSGHVEEINFSTVSDIVRRRTNLLVKRQTWGKIPEYIKGNNMHMRPPLSIFSANIFQTDCSIASTDGRDGEMYFVVSPTIRQRRLVPVPAVLYKNNFMAGYVPELDATVAALGGVDQIVSTIFAMPGQQGSTAQGDHILDLQERIVETAMKEDNWSKLLRSLIPRPGLELQIPRFSHRSMENGSAILQKMGLRDLFNIDKADLRGLNGMANDLHLSDMMLLNTFTTCGEGFVGDQHHVEVYPGEPNKAQRRLWRTQRPVIQEIFEPPVLTDFLEEPRDYQRAFNDPLHDSSYLSMPLHLRPRQARLPESILEPPRLKFDKPFMFFVRHNPTGLILYIGRYNPRLLP